MSRSSICSIICQRYLTENLKTLLLAVFSLSPLTQADITISYTAIIFQKESGANNNCRNKLQEE